MAESPYSFESLPTHILANIFHWSLPTTTLLVNWGEALRTEYASFQRLRLVSRRFSQTFRQYPLLNQSLLVCGPLPLQQLSTLLHWTHKHAGSIEKVVFARESSSCQDVVLGVLVAARTPVLSLSLWAPSLSKSVQSLLPSFSSLTCCGFNSARSNVLDLMPMQALPSLTDLCLQGLGLFTGLHLLPHLTSLTLEDTVVGHVETPSYSCLSTLRHLDLTSSDLYGLDDKGLVACKALETLYCDDCTVGARDKSQALLFRTNSQSDTTYFPAAMTKLTLLTQLELDIGRHGQGQIDMNWIYRLPALQLLVLDNDRSCLISADVSRLSRLTRMKLGTSFECIDSKYAQWGFATDWSSLPALKTLRFCESIIDARDSMLRLVHLVHLTQIDFISCRPADAVSQGNLAQLLEALSARRPAVALAVDMRPVRMSA